MRSLRELQLAFSTSVRNSGCPAPEALAPTTTGDREERFSIYRNAYPLRLIESLATDYPATRKLLGAERFDEFGRGYVESHPSPYFNLRWYGAELADFLLANGGVDGALASAMAAFEWALAGAFDAADAPSITVEDVARVPPDTWPALRFDFHPSLRRLPLPECVPDLWKALLAGTPHCAPTMPQDSAVWVVWRRDLAVVYRRADHDEADSLERAAGGASFADICAGLSAQVGASATAARAAALLRQWVAEGLIAALRPICA
jgi:hypothetical protein